MKTPIELFNKQNSKDVFSKIITVFKRMPIKYNFIVFRALNEVNLGFFGFPSACRKMVNVHKIVGIGHGPVFYFILFLLLFIDVLNIFINVIWISPTHKYEGAMLIFETIRIILMLNILVSAYIGPMIEFKIL